MDQPKRWSILSEKQLKSCVVFDLYKRRCKHPTEHKEGEFYLLKSNDFVQCLALTPDERLIFVQQYRFGADDLCWEFAGGTLDKAETPVQAAVRELQEETGYKGSSVKYLNWCYPNPATLNNRCHFILIEGCMPIGGTQWDEHEEMAIALLKWEEVLTGLKNNQFTHSVVWTSLAMLASYKQWKLF